MAVHMCGENNQEMPFLHTSLLSLRTRALVLIILSSIGRNSPSRARTSAPKAARRGAAGGAAGGCEAGPRPAAAGGGAGATEEPSSGTQPPAGVTPPRVAASGALAGGISAGAAPPAPAAAAGDGAGAAGGATAGALLRAARGRGRGAACATAGAPAPAAPASAAAWRSLRAAQPPRLRGASNTQRRWAQGNPRADGADRVRRPLQDADRWQGGFAMKSFDQNVVSVVARSSNPTSNPLNFQLISGLSGFCKSGCCKPLFKVERITYVRMALRMLACACMFKRTSKFRRRFVQYTSEECRVPFDPTN
jgi:hypothetical protein